MDRPTTEIILPISGNRVVFYEFLTTGQFREIKNLSFKDIKFSPTGSVAGEGISANFIVEGEVLAFRGLVKEVFDKDDKKIEGDLYEYTNELHYKDGQAIYDKINELTRDSDLSPESKKK